MSDCLASPSARVGARSRSSGRITALVDAILSWQERARQRHMLASLDERQLRDMGLTRAEVVLETTKPFWRP